MFYGTVFAPGKIRLTHAYGPILRRLGGVQSRITAQQQTVFADHSQPSVILLSDTPIHGYMVAWLHGYMVTWDIYQTYCRSTRPSVCYDGHAKAGQLPLPPPPRSYSYALRCRFKMSWNMSSETDNSMMHITLSARGIETQGMIVSSSRHIRRVHAIPHASTICNRSCIGYVRIE